MFFISKNKKNEYQEYHVFYIGGNYLYYKLNNPPKIYRGNKKLVANNKKYKITEPFNLEKEDYYKLKYTKFLKKRHFHFSDE